MLGRLRGLFKRSKVYTNEEIAERVHPVAERYDLEYVCVFGSYAKGLADRDSDVDLFVSAHKLRGTEIEGLFLH